jgi:hypothetical protein
MSTCYYGTARRPVDGHLLLVGLKVTANLLNEILTASSHEALIDRIFMACGKSPVFVFFCFPINLKARAMFVTEQHQFHLIKKEDKIVSSKV